jgi:hypothetical protein
MDARTREIERAWIAHQPERARIPPEAWRQLRIFKRSLVPQVARINKAGADRDFLHEVVKDYAFKATLGKQRAFAKLTRPGQGREAPSCRIVVVPRSEGCAARRPDRPG